MRSSSGQLLKSPVPSGLVATGPGRHGTIHRTPAIPIFEVSYDEPNERRYRASLRGRRAGRGRPACGRAPDFPRQRLRHGRPARARRNGGRGRLRLQPDRKPRPQRAGQGDLLPGERAEDLRLFLRHGGDQPCPAHLHQTGGSHPGQQLALRRDDRPDGQHPPPVRD